MAIAVAQNLGTQHFSASSGNATFGSSTTTGNLIVVVVHGERAGAQVDVPTITDSKSNTYTQAVDSGLTTGVSVTNRSQIFYKENATGGASHQITVTFAGSRGCVWSAFEISGALTASSLDQVSSAKGTVAGTDASVGPSSATTQADEIVIVGAGTRADTSANIVMTAASSGYTNVALEQDASTYGTGGSIDYKIVSATGTQSASWSHSNTLAFTEWHAVLATFKAAITSAGQLVNRIPLRTLVGGALVS